MNKIFKNLFRRKQLKSALENAGSHVDTSFLVYVNNESPMKFVFKDDVFDYLEKYRKGTEIFKLQIFKVETYSIFQNI